MEACLFEESKNETNAPQNGEKPNGADDVLDQINPWIRQNVKKQKFIKPS